MITVHPSAAQPTSPPTRTTTETKSKTETQMGMQPRDAGMSSRVTIFVFFFDGSLWLMAKKSLRLPSRLSCGLTHVFDENLRRRWHQQSPSHWSLYAGKKWRCSNSLLLFHQILIKVCRSSKRSQILYVKSTTVRRGDLIR